jgi:hypothetical protein
MAQANGFAAGSLALGRPMPRSEARGAADQLLIA